MTTAATDKRSRLKQMLESGEARLQPLTFPQRELWESTPVPPAHPTNHICSIIHVRGRLTATECTDVMRRVVERQEALRLSILPGREAPLMLIRREMEPNLIYRDEPPGDGSEAAIETWAQEVYRRPFDLVQGPLYCAEVSRVAPDMHVFAFAIHHTIADGWSLGVLVQDLAGGWIQHKTGARHEPLPPVPLTYSAWGASERLLWSPAELARRAAFWQKTLAGRTPVWEGRPGADSLAPLERWVTHLPAELTASVRTLARKAGATLFSTLQAAFRVAFAQWTGVEDLVVGSPVANRSSQSVRETMGGFAGVVPLRARVEKTASFLSTLAAVHEITVDAFSQAMPFVELTRALGDQPAPGHHPIFDVRFALQNHPVPDIEFSSLSARLRMRSTGTARFHLGCEVTEEGDTLEVVWLWRAAVLPRAEVEILSRRFENVLQSVCVEPASAVPDSL